MKTQIEWVSVERELPPDDASPPCFRLIANSGGFVRQATWRHGEWFIGDHALSTVTHWAHMPEHPAQQEKSK